MKNYKNLIFRIKGICGNRKGFALLIIMGFGCGDYCDCDDFAINQDYAD